MAKKRRADAWDAGLTPEKRMQAFEWARELGYEKARILIGKEFEMRAPSLGAMSGWYQGMTARVREADLKKAIVDAAAIRDTAKELGNVSDAVAAGLGQLALDAIVSRDPEKIKLFAKLTLEARKESREDRELALAQAKFAEVQEKNRQASEKLKAAISKGGISQGTIKQIEEALNLL